MAVVEEFEQKLADLAAQIQWERDEIVVLESPSAVDVMRSYERE
ncbi:hypothetical protein [Pararhizobium sp. A13]